MVITDGMSEVHMHSRFLLTWGCVCEHGPGQKWEEVSIRFECFLGQFLQSPQVENRNFNWRFLFQILHRGGIREGKWLLTPMPS